MRFKKGFTLIELLVVIAIIGLLATIVLVSLNTAREKARDTKRKSDLHQIQIALEMYYDDNGKYPGETWCDSSIGSCGQACPCSDTGGWDTGSTFYTEITNDYISVLPVDSLNNTTYYYAYEPTNDGHLGYYFRARMEDTGNWWYVCGGTYKNSACH